MLNMSGSSRAFATFNQIRDSLAIALGVAQKLNTELVVFVPAHD